jgi:hypothetical protein
MEGGTSNKVDAEVADRVSLSAGARSPACPMWSSDED